MKTRGSHLIAEEKKLEIKSWNKQQSSVINIRVHWAKAALWGFSFKKGNRTKGILGQGTLWGSSTRIQHNYSERRTRGARTQGAQSSGYICTQLRWTPWKPQKTSGTSLKQRCEMPSMSQEQVGTIFWIGSWNWAFTSSFPDALET